MTVGNTIDGLAGIVAFEAGSRARCSAFLFLIALCGEHAFIWIFRSLVFVVRGGVMDVKVFAPKHFTHPRVYVLVYED